MWLKHWKVGIEKEDRLTFENKTESQARQEILEQVRQYCDKYHKKKGYQKGDRLPYASRVYDSAKMVNLVDSALEFWLTAGR